ncbi:hypothetical protein DFS34DRAFT_589685 [Phlyctochytrium arcticum]|nr:hypothetical protein DFS34DRAFT_589685 [Phlyctochytrium arcticum]
MGGFKDKPKRSLFGLSFFGSPGNSTSSNSNKQKSSHISPLAPAKASGTYTSRHSRSPSETSDTTNPSIAHSTSSDYQHGRESGQPSRVSLESTSSRKSKSPSMRSRRLSAISGRLFDRGKGEAAPPPDVVRPGEAESPQQSQQHQSEYPASSSSSSSHPHRQSHRIIYKSHSQVTLQSALGSEGGLSAKSEPPPSVRTPVSLGHPILFYLNEEAGLVVQLYFEEHCPHAVAPPSTPNSTQPTRVPILRMPHMAKRLNGTLRIINNRHAFISQRLSVILFTGQGRTNVNPSDPEAPSAAGMHILPIARSATHIWQEAVQVDVGTHDFRFSLPLSGGIPPSLQAFSAAHAHREDISHIVFLKLRRKDGPHAVSRTELALQPCPVDDVVLVHDRRVKTEAGAVADGLILFRAEVPEVANVDTQAIEVYFQAVPSGAPNNCVIIDSLECCWKEKVMFRKANAGSFNRLDRPLHPSLSKHLAHSVPDAPVRFVSQFNAMIQPDGMTDNIRVSHEVVLTINFFATPLDSQLHQATIAIPVRFVCSMHQAREEHLLGDTPLANLFHARAVAVSRALAPQQQYQVPLGMPPAMRQQMATSNAQLLPQQPRPLSIQPPAIQVSHAPRTPPLVNVTAPEPVAPRPRHAAGEKYRSQFPFQATDQDEMSLNVGDTILIWESFDDGWASGQNLTSNTAGFFPLNALGDDAWRNSVAFAAGMLAPPESIAGKLSVLGRKASRRVAPLQGQDRFGGPEATQAYAQLLQHQQQIRALSATPTSSAGGRSNVDSGVGGLANDIRDMRISDMIAPSAEPSRSANEGPPEMRPSLPGGLGGSNASLPPLYSAEPLPTSNLPQYAGIPGTISQTVTPVANYEGIYGQQLVASPHGQELNAYPLTSDMGRGTPSAESRSFKPKGEAPSRTYSLERHDSNLDDSKTKLASARPRHQYKVVRAFIPQQKGQIEVRYGDIVVIDEQHANGWCLGANLVSGHHGRFPTSSVDMKPVQMDVSENIPSLPAAAAPQQQLTTEQRLTASLWQQPHNGSTNSLNQQSTPPSQQQQHSRQQPQQFQQEQHLIDVPRSRQNTPPRQSSPSKGQRDEGKVASNGDANLPAPQFGHSFLDSLGMSFGSSPPRSSNNSSNTANGSISQQTTAENGRKPSGPSLFKLPNSSRSAHVFQQQSSRISAPPAIRDANSSTSTRGLGPPQADYRSHPHSADAAQHPPPETYIARPAHDTKDIDGRSDITPASPTAAKDLLSMLDGELVRGKIDPKEYIVRRDEILEMSRKGVLRGS